jgi:hypothetical protein
MPAGCPVLQTDQECAMNESHRITGAARALSTARLGFPVDKLMMKPAGALPRLPRATH